MQSTNGKQDSNSSKQRENRLTKDQGKAQKSDWKNPINPQLGLEHDNHNRPQLQRKNASQIQRVITWDFQSSSHRPENGLNCGNCGLKILYPLVNVYKSMRKAQCGQWVHQPFLWPFSIAMCHYQVLCTMNKSLRWSDSPPKSNLQRPS